jgi:hypothetical protein
MRRLEIASAARSRREAAASTDGCAPLAARRKAKRVLSDRMKDEYINAFDDLATVEFDDNPATCRLVGNSDPPSPAPYEEDRFLGLRLDRGILVHFISLPPRP